MDTTTQTVPNDMLQDSVSNYVGEHGSWDWSQISHFLSHSSLLTLSSVSAPQANAGADNVI